MISLWVLIATYGPCIYIDKRIRTGKYFYVLHCIYFNVSILKFKSINCDSGLRGMTSNPEQPLIGNDNNTIIRNSEK